MREWQEQYLRNVREVADIRPLFGAEQKPFDAWYDTFLKRETRLRVLREENTHLLNERFFPMLDALPSLDAKETESLVAFGDALMDWSTNLDCGIYVAIHDALLRLCRIRRDRPGMIRELYKLGMGLFYLQRAILGVECREADSMNFRNEMVFTEAASYFRWFADMPDSDTQAYILRAMANVSLCAAGSKRRIAASMRFMRVIRSPEYRAIAPELPWDTYYRRACMQLSTCRSQLSDSAVTREEVAAVMDACWEVFRPEQQTDNPSVRWLWPYYDMEFRCGYVSAETTADRMERLIREAAEDRFDVAGLYGSVQLPINYGKLLQEHEKLLRDADRRRFLGEAQRKLMRALMGVPPEMVDENLTHTLVAVVSDYFEVEEGPSYRELTNRLMERFAGRLYLRSARAGELLVAFCAFIYDREPDYFRHLPPLRETDDPAMRREILLSLARDCGLYHDFGLFKMNLERTELTRNLFEQEDAMMRLHTVSGYDDLRKRASTAAFADVARGHHSAWAGGGNDPSGYVRLDSPWRQLTDLTALVSDLLEHDEEGFEAWLIRARRESGRLFAPRAAAFLAEDALCDAMARVLAEDGYERCRKAYDLFYAPARETASGVMK